MARLDQPVEDVKEELEREEIVRQDHILLRKIYDIVLDIQCDMGIRSKDKQIDKMKKEVEKLNKEINYCEENKRYIRQCKYDMLDERY